MGKIPHNLKLIFMDKALPAQLFGQTRLPLIRILKQRQKMLTEMFICTILMRNLKKKLSFTHIGF